MLMVEAWTAVGESKMANTFVHMYVMQDDFNEWRYNSSGIPGCYPDNNPLESHNNQTKGGPHFPGLLSAGASMAVMLQAEFPRMTYSITEAKGNLLVEEPILNYNAMCADGALYEFFTEFSFERNRRPYNNGYICCSLDELHMEISDDDIRLMEQSMQGIFYGNFEVRKELLKATERFHVIWVEKRNAQDIWTCDCRDYYRHKWCRVTAAHQHSEQLRLDAPRIQGTKSAIRRKTHKQRDMDLLNVSKKQKRMNNNAAS
jgi:hypothetical protein